MVLLKKIDQLDTYLKKKSKYLLGREEVGEFAHIHGDMKCKGGTFR